MANLRISDWRREDVLFDFVGGVMVLRAGAGVVLNTGEFYS
jgi:hypothetical protein